MRQAYVYEPKLGIDIAWPTLQNVRNGYEQQTRNRRLYITHSDIFLQDIQAWNEEQQKIKADFATIQTQMKAYERCVMYERES